MNFIKLLVILLITSPILTLSQQEKDIQWANIQAGYNSVVKFSPTGNLVAAADAKTIKIWDANSYELKNFLVDQNSTKVLCLSFSDDEKYLYAGEQKNEETYLKKINITTNTIESEIKVSDNPAFRLDISSDNKYAALTKKDSSISVWNIDEGRLVRTFDKAMGYATLVIAFSPDGVTLAGVQAGGVFLINVENGQLTKRIDIETIPMSGIRFGPDKKSVIVFKPGSSPIKIIDTETENIMTLYKSGLLSAWMTDDSKSVIGFSTDSVYKLDIETQEVTFRAKKCYGQTGDFISKPGKSVLAVSGNGFELWDMEKEAMIKRISKAFSGPVAFSGMGELLISFDTYLTNSDCKYTVSNAENGEYLNSFIISANMNFGQYRPIPRTNNYLNTTRKDTFWLNKLIDGSVHSFYTFPNQINSALASPGLRLLALAAQNARIYVYDCEKKIYIDSTTECFPIVYSGNSRYLLSTNFSDSDIVISVRDIEKHENVFNIPMGQNYVTSFFSNDEKYIYILRRDSALLKYDIESSSLAREFKDIKYLGDAEKLSLEVTPDDKFLIRTLDSSIIQIYNLETEKEEYRYDFRGLKVSYFAMSPDYKYIAALYEDNSLVMWKIRVGPNGVAENLKYKPDNIVVYPNPAKSEISIMFPDKPGEFIKCDLFDINGNLLLSSPVRAGESQSRAISINTDGLASGMYFVKITTEKETVYRPVVISR